MGTFAELTAARITAHRARELDHAHGVALRMHTIWLRRQAEEAAKRDRQGRNAERKRWDALRREYVREIQLAKILSRYEVDENGCWIWRGGKNPSGYGKTSWQGEDWLAHRFFFTRFVGPITEETIDHVWERGCRSHACVNPAHLEQVSLAENLRRRHTVV